VNFLLLCFQANNGNIHFDNEKFRFDRGMKESIQRRESFDFDAQACSVLKSTWVCLSIKLTNPLDVLACQASGEIVSTYGFDVHSPVAV
jgi:hypothetical protein